MKKLFFLLLLCSPFFLAGCGSDDDDATHCWEFSVTVTTTIEGSAEEPMTATTSTTQCDLTEKQAEEVVKSLTTESTTTIGGVTQKTKTTVTKTRK